MKNRGFTLIELSIVLIIIGLVIGGMLIGKEIIVAAQTRSLINEVSQYLVLIRAFRDKYSYYPGDFPNASIVFGITGTDGNGDGMIMYAGYNGESYQAWYHLKIAGMINGNYYGKFSQPISSALTNPNALLSLEYNNDVLYKIAANTKNALLYYGQNMSGSIISPSQAYNIDIKIDDGIPTLGKVMTSSFNPTPSDCILTSDGGSTYANKYYPYKGYYNIRESNKTCDRIYFYLDY